jgi:predicted dehydrogenase
VALAGAGAIAAVHALAAQAAGIRVAAVASAGGSSARHLAGQLDARRVAPEDLPAGADLLVVATPPDTHTDLALQGLAAGSAVLVEKPIATTLADADRLVAASEDPGNPPLRCAENLLFAPAWRSAESHRRRIGPLRHLSARTMQPPPTWGHFARPLRAGGVLLDLGPHAIALVLRLAGADAVGVTAELSSTRPDGADDDAHVTIRFASGLVAAVDVSWTTPEADWTLQAAGEDGVVLLQLFPDVTVEVDGDQVALVARHTSAADPALEQFGYVDQLLDVDHAQTAPDARDVLEVICAAYASAGAGGTEVPLPFTGDRSLTPMQLWHR